MLFPLVCGVLAERLWLWGRQPSQGQPAVKTFRYAMDQAPTTLDPVQASNIYANFVIANAYDTLYSYQYLARPYQLKPNLAVDFPTISPDGLTYTFHLKKGVHFVDDPCFPGGRGREVVAEDLVYSIKRQFDPKNRPQGAWLWQDRIAGLDEWKAAGSDYRQPVSGLRVLDAYTLEVKLLGLTPSWSPHSPRDMRRLCRTRPSRSTAWGSVCTLLDPVPSSLSPMTPRG